MKSRTFWRVRRETDQRSAQSRTVIAGVGTTSGSTESTIQLIPCTSAFAPAVDACGFDVLATPQAGRPNKERLIQFNSAAIVAGPPSPR
jgi:hypothetical protein